MRKIALPVHILVGVVAICLLAAPAHAQATRTWVSGVGDDANPCSRTAPCKTFAGAISKTSIGGEINVLDPGGFGAVTITKSISIISVYGPYAGVLVAGTNGIVVSVGPNDKVLLEGLDIEGLGASPSTPGLNGVQIIGQGRTTVRKCSIRNFSQNAVNLVGGDQSRVVIEDSLFLNNGGGVNVNPAAGNNFAVLKNSTLDNNTNFSTQINGAGNALILIGSTLTGSATAIGNTGATVISYGNNVIRGAGAPTQTLLLQ
ncbi:MAG TPA: right-handed parallel beta-helix repeat-containing protein [Vicinamibacterales bacterium]|jgi:hypothetical protein|nr:right-handed parallel beta-helix repeat-containing protein [Vicinamibacterales bacterium]